MVKDKEAERGCSSARESHRLGLWLRTGGSSASSGGACAFAGQLLCLTLLLLSCWPSHWLSTWMASAAPWPLLPRGLCCHMALAAHGLCCSVASALPWPLLPCGLCCPMASAVLWPLLTHGLCCSVASTVLWPLLPRGLCFPIASAVLWPLLSCGLCWPGDSATWCLSLLFMRSAVRPPGFKPWRSCFLAGWPWATD